MKNLLHKKSLLFTLFLLLFMSGYSQGFFVKLEEIVQEDGCIRRDDPNGKTYRVLYSPELYPIGYSTEGDIYVSAQTDSTVTIKTSSSYYGKGRLYASGTFDLDTSHPCVSLGCTSSEGLVDTYVEVYQKFDVNALGEKITGSDNIISGQSYAFSVNPILTRNLFDYIGIDRYMWEYPSYMGLEYSVADSSSFALQVSPNAQIGDNDTMKVFVGRCNMDNPLVKLFKRGIDKPLVDHDSLICIDTNTVRFWIRGYNPEYNYRFDPSDLSWIVTPVTDSCFDVVGIESNGKVILRVDNGFDTVIEEFDITRKITHPTEIQGDSICLERDRFLPYRLYPSPNVEVDWILPEGWDLDPNNPLSSATFFKLGKEATTGVIKAYSKACGELFDSIYVSVQSNYEPEPIISDNGICFAAGDMVTFRFKRDPNARSYQWQFPSDWSPATYTTTDINDTVVHVVVGAETGSIQLTGTPLCGDAWTMTFDSVYAYPSEPAINLVSSLCINDGVTDTITLFTTKTNTITSYQWIYPTSWSVLNIGDTSITLQTDNIGGSREVLLIGKNQQCGQSADTGRITITPTGANVASVSIMYSRMPIAPAPPVLHIFNATVNPAGSNYNYFWYTQNGVSFGNNSSQSVITQAAFPIDTSLNNYCVVVQNKSTGCLTRKWLKDTVNGGYSDTIVETIPPAGSKQLAASGDDDDDEEDTPPAPQSTPKVSKPVARKAPAVEPSFSFYPNPTQNNIYIQFSNGAADYIEIVNLMGVSMLKKRCPDGQMELNVSHLKRGIYIVKVTFGNKIVSDKLYIVK